MCDVKRPNLFMLVSKDFCVIIVQSNNAMSKIFEISFFTNENPHNSSKVMYHTEKLEKFYLNNKLRINLKNL